MALQWLTWDNWPLKDIFTELKLKTIAFCINYQVRLQKAIESVESGPAIQVKFHCLFRLQGTVSFLAVEFITAETRVGCFTKGRPFYYFRSKTCFRYSLVISSICSLIKIGIYKRIDRSERNRSLEFQLKFPRQSEFIFYQCFYFVSTFCYWQSVTH